MLDKTPVCVWLVTSGEPLPIDDDSPRLLRHGLLAQALRAKGYHVLWWTSSFDHTSKKHRKLVANDTVYIDPDYRIKLLPSQGYKRNISWARIKDHRQIARAFLERAENEPVPDVILCSYPTVELSLAATQYGKAAGVPVVLDIRDLWPDIFLELFPQFLQAFARMALYRGFKNSRAALKNAHAIVGITDAIMHWGLAAAGRSASPLDRSFPLAYPDKAALKTLEDGALHHQTMQRWQALGVTKDKFTICFFGALGRQFDFATVIEAARQMRVLYPQVLFVMCGVGKQLGKLQLAGEKIGNIIAPGWLGQSDIHYLMSQASAGLAPYINEYSFTLSIPNKIIEYASGALPILYCLKGSTHDLIQSHGMGVAYEEYNAHSLCQAIGYLLNQPELRLKMAQQSRQWYMRDMRAEVVYASMSEYLHDVACSRVLKPSLNVSET